MKPSILVAFLLLGLVVVVLVPQVSANASEIIDSLSDEGNQSKRFLCVCQLMPELSAKSSEMLGNSCLKEIRIAGL